MPHKDIQERFRVSELALLGWRSRESAIAMHKKFHRPRTELNQHGVPKLIERSDLPQGIPTVEIKDKWGNVIGEEPDMTQMTAQQLVAHLGAAGYNIPMIPHFMKKRQN